MKGEQLLPATLISCDAANCVLRGINEEARWSNSNLASKSHQGSTPHYYIHTDNIERPTEEWTISLSGGGRFSRESWHQALDYGRQGSASQGSHIALNQAKPKVPVTGSR
jgi:hypothetical protein